MTSRRRTRDLLARAFDGTLDADGWLELGECKWGTVRSAPGLAAELDAKVVAHPNPRNATIGRRVSIVLGVTKIAPSCHGVSWCTQPMILPAPSFCSFSALLATVRIASTWPPVSAAAMFGTLCSRRSFTS